MTLLFADGFEDGALSWSLNNVSVGAGRFGNGLVLISGGSEARYGVAPATAGPIIAGFAFKPGSNALAAVGGFLTLPYNAISYLVRGVAGEISVLTASSTYIGSTGPNVLPAGAWSYIELKTVVHTTTGSVVIRVNGVQVLNLTNVNTAAGGPTTINAFGFGQMYTTSSTDNNAYDDFYLANTAGTVNNDFLGELSVEHLRPASDDTAQWLGSDGNSVNNWDLVDEAGTYNGADYVASSTVGQRELYVPVPSARPITGPVVAVMPVAVSQKTDAGVRTVKMNVKEGAGGTVRQSADLGLPTTFGEVWSIFERKGDGSQFTVADVNALRFGLEVST